MAYGRWQIVESIELRAKTRVEGTGDIET